MSLSDYDIDSDAALDVSSGDEDDGVMAEGSGTSGLEDDEDEDEQNGEDILDDTTDDAEASSGAEEVAGPRKRKAREMEAEYEQSGRTRWAAPPPKPEEDSVEVGRLPIKLANGQVQKVEGTTRVPLPPSKKSAPEPDSESEEVEPVDDVDSDDGAQVQRMAGKKGRFGRMGVGEIVGTKGWKSMQRLEAAKEQIAAIGAEVMAGGELVDIVRRRCFACLPLIACFRAPC